MSTETGPETTLGRGTDFEAALAERLRECEERLHRAEAALRRAEADLSERTRSEARLQASLDAKETLLREIHHRVKNNLQIVCSLLSLQRGTVRGQTVQEILRESEERVRCIATIHEHLYRSADRSSIQLCAHVRAVAADVSRGRDGTSLSVECHEQLALGLDTAVPLGLVLHELVTNAFQHAFPRGAGNVRVVVRQADGVLVVTVRDDGVGIPPGWERRLGESLGLKLVMALTRQLGGGLAIHVDGGTEVTCRIPVPTHAGHEPPTAGASA